MFLQFIFFYFWINCSQPLSQHSPHCAFSIKNSSFDITPLGYDGGTVLSEKFTGPWGFQYYLSLCSPQEISYVAPQCSNLPLYYCQLNELRSDCDFAQRVNISHTYLLQQTPTKTGCVALSNGDPPTASLLDSADPSLGISIKYTQGKFKILSKHSNL